MQRHSNSLADAEYSELPFVLDESSLPPVQGHVVDLMDLGIYFLGQEWRNDAACATVDTDLFFPERGIPGEKIRDLCFSCPVRLDCLEFSVTSMPKFGWFGGHPENGRRAVKRLVEGGVPLETADAIVLTTALKKMRKKTSPQLSSRELVEVA